MLRLSDAIPAKEPQLGNPLDLSLDLSYAIA